MYNVPHIDSIFKFIIDKTNKIYASAIGCMHSLGYKAPTLRHKYINLRLKCKEEFLFDTVMISKMIRAIAEFGYKGRCRQKGGKRKGA